MVSPNSRTIADVRRMRHPSLIGVLVVFLALFFVDLKNSYNYSTLQSTAGVEALDFAARSGTYPCISPDAIDIPACRDKRQRAIAELNVGLAVNSVRLGAVAAALDDVPGMVEFSLHELTSGWGASLVVALLAVSTALQRQNNEEHRVLLALGSREQFNRVRARSLALVTSAITLMCGLMGAVWVTSRDKFTLSGLTTAATTPSVESLVNNATSGSTWGSWEHLAYRAPFALAVVMLLSTFVVRITEKSRTVLQAVMSGIGVILALNFLARYAPAVSPNSAIAATFRLNEYPGLHDVRSWTVPGRPRFLGTTGGIRSATVVSSLVILAAGFVWTIVVANRNNGTTTTQSA